VNGVLAGFYKGQAPTLVGDGKKTIRELIEEKDSKRQGRVEPIRVSKELHDHILRSGFAISDILPKGISLPLTYRVGRLFGGRTIEMWSDLHPSFIPIFEKAAKTVGLSVVGFDAIIPDPTKPASSDRWGIIECNSLPFIDLHYYALEGKPKNIAGMIWDMWKQNIET
jgi:cyanophycin synthetase